MKKKKVARKVIFKILFKPKTHVNVLRNLFWKILFC